MEGYENDFTNCEFCEQSDYEYDTGYAEYFCGLLGYECMGEYCPLSFKYKVEEENPCLT